MHKVVFVLSDKMKERLNSVIVSYHSRLYAKEKQETCVKSTEVYYVDNKSYNTYMYQEIHNGVVKSMIASENLWYIPIEIELYQDNLYSNYRLSILEEKNKTHLVVEFLSEEDFKNDREIKKILQTVFGSSWPIQTPIHSTLTPGLYWYETPTDYRRNRGTWEEFVEQAEEDAKVEIPTACKIPVFFHNQIYCVRLIRNGYVGSANTRFKEIYKSCAKIANLQVNLENKE